ncbi:RNA-binding protein Musashi Rbp6 [Amphibalanus amphitrite]|uniref:RNA-binding protein Musashi Rbp6 n=1 Tax=Amphibalanus amphitrite TaxID=1232801 RepID=A0A6A4VSY8_AMPAM|nr:RNA-binding protein Musashi Rbp6 [Amphibalanus amphitrite]
MRSFFPHRISISDRAPWPGLARHSVEIEMSRIDWDGLRADGTMDALWFGDSDRTRREARYVTGRWRFGKTPVTMVTRTKKIFVGGLSAPSTLEDVKNYFEQFGRVECKKAQPKEVMLPQTLARGRTAPRGGYGFQAAAAYAAYAGRGYSSYPGFGFPYAGFTSYGYFPSPAGAALASNGSSDRANGTTYYQEYSAGAVPAAGPVSLSTPSRTENHVSQSPLHRDNPYGTRTDLMNGGMANGSGPLLTQALSVINNYPGYGPPASPANSRGFGPANSPGPLDMTYNGDTSLGYLQAASPQPSFGAMNRAPLLAAFNGYH